MMSPMDRLKYRLEHAWSQREVFDRELKSFMDGRCKPYSIRQQKQRKTGHYVITAEPVREIPPRLAFLIGDCIHNLRATLDNLITVLPGADPQNSAFVILDRSPVDRNGKPISFLDKTGGRLIGIDQRAFDTVERLQPYQGLDGPLGLVRFNLRTLEYLWNRDKHRQPSILLATLQFSAIIIPANEWFVTDVQYGALDERKVLWRVIWTGDRAAPKMKFVTKIAADVVFEKDGRCPVGGYRVRPTLIDLHNCVRNDVLPLFEEFLQ